MPERLVASPAGFMLCDPEYSQLITPQWFDQAFWRARDACTPLEAGRGAAAIVRGPFGDAVLRAYRRGGFMAHVSQDRYLFDGLSRTRSFREFRLLQELRARGLAVPPPIAAWVARSGLSYRAAILVGLIPAATGFAQLAAESPLSLWEAVGTCIGRFHAQGAWHADLNANNVIVDGEGRVYLIDFDRGRLRAPARNWQQANLARLHRSLTKLGIAVARTDFEAAWAALIGAHAGALG